MICVWVGLMKTTLMQLMVPVYGTERYIDIPIFIGENGDINVIADIYGPAGTYPAMLDLSDALK